MLAARRASAALYSSAGTGDGGDSVAGGTDDEGISVLSVIAVAVDSVFAAAVLADGTLTAAVGVGTGTIRLGLNVRYALEASQNSSACFGRPIRNM